MSSFRLHDGPGYEAWQTPEGVLVTQWYTGEQRFFQGDDAAELTQSLEVVAARIPVEKVEAATDEYLSQYFGE